MGLSIVALSPDISQQYTGMIRARGQQLPFPTPQGIFVVEDNVLVCGLSLYPTAGGWVLVEHLVANNNFPGPKRSKAVAMALEAVQVHAASVGRAPLLLNPGFSPRGWTKVDVFCRQAEWTEPEKVTRSEEIGARAAAPEEEWVTAAPAPAIRAPGDTEPAKPPDEEDWEAGVPSHTLKKASRRKGASRKKRQD